MQPIHEHPAGFNVDARGGGVGDGAPVDGGESDVAHASHENRFPVDLLLTKSLQVEGSFT